MYKTKVERNNPIIYKIISNAIENNKLAHSYIFAAQKGTRIDDEPLFVVESVISTADNIRDPLAYSDLIIIENDNSIIKKDFIITAIENLQRTTLDSLNKKFLIIKNLENANKQSLNSLLKFLEEPTPNTYILFTTNNLSKVISTIKSRSQILTLRSTNQQNIIDSLIESNVSSSVATITTRLTSDATEALKLANEKSFIELLNLLKDSVENGTKNFSNLFIDLSKIINKHNYLQASEILKEIFNDIWRREKLLDLTFPELSLTMDEFLSRKFNYHKALEALNEFLVHQSSYVNFDLSKNNFLIVLGECYE